MKQLTDLTKKVLPYSQKKLWVALSPDNYAVVGTGKSPKKALEEARKKKINYPILFQAISDYSGFVPQIKR